MDKKKINEKKALIMINNYNLSYYNLNTKTEEAFKCIGSFLADKYSSDTKNFGDFKFNIRIEPSIELNLERMDKKLSMTVQDVNNDFCTFISWEERNKLSSEIGIKTLLILSNFSLSLLYDFEKDETLN